MKNNINEITLVIVAILACLWISIQSDASDTIKVMVIDTGVDLSHKEIKKHVNESSNNRNYEDEIGHGTAMADLVLRNTCLQVELISCRYYPENQNSAENSNKCFQRAFNEKVDFINYSSGGEGENKEEKEILKKISDNGTIIVVSAGNDGKNLIKNGKCEKYFPACYLLPNMYIIQNIDEQGFLYYNSNYLDDKNARKEIGVNVPVLIPKNKTGYITGTSPAAAKYTNKLLLHKCWELNK